MFQTVFCVVSVDWNRLWIGDQRHWLSWQIQYLSSELMHLQILRRQCSPDDHKNNPCVPLFISCKVVNSPSYLVLPHTLQGKSSRRKERELTQEFRAANTQEADGKVPCNQSVPPILPIPTSLFASFSLTTKQPFSSPSSSLASWPGIWWRDSRAGHPQWG